MTVPAEVEEDLKLAPAMFGPLLDAGLGTSLLLLFVVVCPISSTVMNPGSETPARIRILRIAQSYFKRCLKVRLFLKPNLFQCVSLTISERIHV